MSGLPTNSGRAKDQGCNPVSSNCVVWQGPDLECIGLCKGDTISDVIAKMATQLCTLVDMFDLSEFDFTCLAVPVSEQPDDTGGLIQILINRICALEGISPIDPANPSGDCPDNCLVPIADCFFYIDPSGDTVTTMTLLDYVNAIGKKICEILDEIVTLQTNIATLNDQVNGDGSGDPIVSPGGLTGEVGDIKSNYATIDSLQYQVNTKTNPAGPTEYIIPALRDVENANIMYNDAAGTPNDTYIAVLRENNIGEKNRAFGQGLYNSITGWINDPKTTADMDNNQWLVINNINQAVDYINENCCSTGCSDLTANFRIDVSGPILTIFFDGSTGFTPDWTECTGSSKIKVTDENGNSTTITTSLIALIDQPLGYAFNLTPTGVDFTTNVTAVATTCFLNTATETQCNQDYTDTVYQSPSCPSVVLTVYSTSINYQFSSTPDYTYIINVYYAAGITPVATQIISTPGAVVLQSIMGLLGSTNYDFEVVIVDGTGTETPCARQGFTTLIADCQPPINAVAILTIP